MGFWSSIVILLCGAVLLCGIVASVYFLPTALTTEWKGIESYADAYRATGGIITSMPFLAALLSCPAYVIQIRSINRVDKNANATRTRFGFLFAMIFAMLAGLNYAIQLFVVRPRILSGQSEGVAWLVFQNPRSPMLVADFVGWFFLSLAFLSVVPFFSGSRLYRSIRYFLVAIGLVGIVLLLGVATGNPDVGVIFLTSMSVLLTCVDILLIVFFRSLM